MTSPAADPGPVWPSASAAQMLLAIEDFWRWSGLVAPVLATTHASAAAVSQIASQRYLELLRFARNRSRFYAQHFRYLPEDAPLESLPVVSRHELMRHFDDWVTDPALRRADLEGFIADPSRRGEPYLVGTRFGQVPAPLECPVFM